MHALLLLPLLLVLLMLWQHLRYLRVRREIAQDFQSQFHSSRAFHVLVFFRLRDGGRFVPAAADFSRTLVEHKRARLVHAGLAAFALESAQLGDRAWNGVLMLEFPSRKLFEKSSQRLEDAADSIFADHYFQGMRRMRRFSLLMPQLLLLIRMIDIFRSRWRLPELEYVPPFRQSDDHAQWQRRVARLQALHQVNPHGLVIYNLLRYGDGTKRKQNHKYHRAMMSRMAALKHGPLNVGRAVSVHENALFDEAVSVLYPSAGYLAELFSSEFYQTIVRNKQLADTLVVPTIPMTGQVLEEVESSLT